MQKLSLTLPLWFGAFLGWSILAVSRVAADDKDAKRLVASTTVIMTGVIFCALGIQASQMALLICVLHAAYKSTLFVVTGKLIAESTVSQETAYSAGQVSVGLFVLVMSFAAALPGSSYAATKHGLGALSQFSAGISGIGLVFSAGALLIWALSLKLLASIRFRGAAFGYPDWVATAPVLALLGVGLLLPAGANLSSSTT